MYTQHDRSQPGYYDEAKPAESHSKWNPKNWSKCTIITVVIAAIVIIVAVIVGAVLGTRSSPYPDYTTLTYSLKDTYHGTDFFQNFDYFNTYDPSQGYVHYVDEATATSEKWNLTYASSSSAILKVDSTNTNATTGRYSVRITSKKQYSDGLFVFNVTNSPYGCSTWPALWLSDQSNWPYHGEIDVMEGVNQAVNGNQMTLHTTDDCKMNVKRKETGKVLTNNCYNGTDDNAGCGVQDTTPSTFGQAFNEKGGGTYAMELRDAGIRMWFWQRGNEPGDIPTDVANTSAPNPNSWGTPLADFPSTHCNIGNHFSNLSIIANIDLCGAWAGAEGVYNKQDQCPGKCVDFVTYNNTAYETAFWDFASFRVYGSN